MKKLSATIKHQGSTTTYVKKGSSERYDLSCTDSTWCWAIITIDEDGGLLNIQSDYGDYAYIWSRHGRPSLKHFLIGIGRDYLLTKLGQGEKMFYLDETIKELKSDLLVSRKQGDISVEDRKEMLKEVAEVARERPQTVDQYIQLVTASHELSKHYSDLYGLPLITGPCWQLVNFADKIWPVFIKILEREISFVEGKLN